MGEAVPVIHYWYGRPIGEMPREELESEFIAAHQQIQRLRAELASGNWITRVFQPLPAQEARLLGEALDDTHAGDKP